MTMLAANAKATNKSTQIKGKGHPITGHQGPGEGVEV
jgi:hypothetical protein